MDLDTLAQLDPIVLRDQLPGFLAGYIDDPDACQRDRARLQALTRSWDAGVAAELFGALATLGQEHRIYDPHPAARQVSRAWCEDVVLDPQVRGLEHLDDTLGRGPIVFISNHLAYFDSTALDAALVHVDRADVADQVVSLAGPKVYADLFRRFASSCIATLPVPQSTKIEGSEDLSPRELVRRVRASLNAAEAGLKDGRHLLIYAEGSRSRSGRLGPFLQGVARYLATDGTIVVPVALVGTQDIMPVARHTATPGTLSLHFGAPIPVAQAGGPKLALDLAHASIANLLPEPLRPA